MGMSAEFMKHMYEPFSQEKRSEAVQTPGTGLGLSIVRRYVDLLGGTIRVESRLHKGTRWTVTLPVKKLESDLTEKPKAASEDTLQGKRVLLCEDTELLAGINRAISQMDINLLDWRHDLWNKYYTADSNGEIAFTAEEKAYLDEMKKSGAVLRAIVEPDRAPYSYFENGEAKGIIPEIFSRLEEMTGLNFEIAETKDRTAYFAALASDKASRCESTHTETSPTRSNAAISSPRPTSLHLSKKSRAKLPLRHIPRWRLSKRQTRPITARPH
jgi:hypothetical protein